MSELSVWMFIQSVKFRKSGGGESKVTDFSNLQFLGYGNWALLEFLEKASSNPDSGEDNVQDFHLLAPRIANHSPHYISATLLVRSSH